MNIERIADKMTKEARLFYQKPEEKRTLTELKEHRDYLDNLLQKVKVFPVKNKRVMEVFGILNDAVIYFNRKIKERPIIIIYGKQRRN